MLDAVARRGRPHRVKRLLSTPGGKAALVVAVVQVLALARWLGAGLHVDDVSYLSSLEAIVQGLEAPRPMRHLSWGLLHAVGHLPLDPTGWACGLPGLALQAFGGLVVAWAAWVAWSLARGLGLEERAAAIAAVLASASPAVLLVAGMAGGLPRWLGVGTALLAVGVGAQALRGLAVRTGGETTEARIVRRILARRRMAAAVLLFGLGLAWHPSAVGVLAVAALVWGASVRAAPPGSRGWAMAGSMWAACLLLAISWVQLSGQGGMAAIGARSLASALWAKPAVGLAQLAWSLPAVGRLMPSLPPAVAVTTGATCVVALLAWRPTRFCGLLAAGACAALIPEAAALGYTPELASSWTINHVEASFGLTIAAALGLAIPLARLRGRTWLTVAVVLALLVGLRSWLLVDVRRDDARADAAMQRLVGHELMAGLAGSARQLQIVGDPAALSRPLKALKWIPEVPSDRRRLQARGPRPSASYGLEHGGMGIPVGLDPAFWTMASIRCELRLGVPRDRRGACRVPNLRSDRAHGACLLDLTVDPPEVDCAPPPEPAGPSASRDARARGWALLALLVLSLTGYLGRGRSSASISA